MDKQYITRIVLQQSRPPSSYSEREAAVLSHVGIGELRHLHALGMVEGVVAGGSCAIARKRYYSCGASAGCSMTLASTLRELK